MLECLTCKPIITCHKNIVPWHVMGYCPLAKVAAQISNPPVLKSFNPPSPQFFYSPPFSKCWNQMVMESGDVLLFCSCERIGNLFADKFSDSETAKKFSLGRNRCSYFVNLVIAPHFKTMLLHNIQKLPFFMYHLMDIWIRCYRMSSWTFKYAFGMRILLRQKHVISIPSFR